MPLRRQLRRSRGRIFEAALDRENRRDRARAPATRRARGNLVVGNLRQQMGNAVKPRPLLVDCLDDPPRRLGNVGAIEHLFLGFGILLPTGP